MSGRQHGYARLDLDASDPADRERMARIASGDRLRLTVDGAPLTPAREALRTVTTWTGRYADGRTGEPMSRAEAQRTCRAAIRAGLDAEAIVAPGRWRDDGRIKTGDVLRVRVLPPEDRR